MKFRYLWPPSLLGPLDKAIREGSGATAPRASGIAQSDSPSVSGRPATTPGRAGRWWNASWFDTVQFLVFCGALLWLVVSGAMSIGYSWQWYRVPQFIVRIVDGELIWGPLAAGLAVTLQITACSVVLALAIGLVTAFLRLSDSLAGRAVSKVYLETVRNTPLLIQMCLFYFVLGPIIGLDRFWVGVWCLSVFEGAFACEVIRAGILSVPRGQREAGDSIGLGRAQVYRHVVLPQAVPLMLPPLTGLMVSLIKNSAIVSVIAVLDLTTAGRDIVAETFMSFEIWMTVAAIYLGITVPLSVLMNYVERRVRTCD